MEVAFEEASEVWLRGVLVTLVVDAVVDAAVAVEMRWEVVHSAWCEMVKRLSGRVGALRGVRKPMGPSQLLSQLLNIAFATLTWVMLRI